MIEFYSDYMLLYRTGLNLLLTDDLPNISFV